jgi:hypothetical protein
MTEAEAAPTRLGAHEAGGREDVEHPRLGAVAGGRGGDVRVERVAGHGRALEQPACAARQARELATHDGAHGAGELAVLVVVAEAHELGQEERIALCLGGDAPPARGVGDRRQHLVAGRGGQGAEIEPPPRRRGSRGVEDAVGDRPPAGGEHEDVRRARRPVQQMEDPLAEASSAQWRSSTSSAKGRS